MDVRALRYFVEVVRQSSFTKAAQVLFVTQPTISKMVRQLETELGTPLPEKTFNRGATDYFVHGDPLPAAPGRIPGGQKTEF